MMAVRPDPLTGEPDPQDHQVAEYRPLTPAEQRVRKRRALATALALGAFVLLVFLISMARLQTNIAAGAGG